ncbi:MAG: nitroreductase family protein [Bacillota bacterium]
MELEKILNKRRSVRKFKDNKVSKEAVIDIIKAGVKAPTAGNLQPWRFLYTLDQKKINQAVDSTYPGNKRDSKNNQDWIRKAPVLILACIDYSDTVNKYGEHGKKAAVQDVAAAVENMVLKTVDLGLATCWISGFREKELKEVFDVPSDVEVLAFLPIGYNAGYHANPSKKDFDSIVYRDCYGKKA